MVAITRQVLFPYGDSPLVIHQSPISPRKSSGLRMRPDQTCQKTFVKPSKSQR